MTSPKKLIASIAPLLKQARITWWRRARAELTMKDPMHPDLPVIVRRIRELEGA
jgi:hypothetical protein